jgi:hypothetical protein
MLQSSNDAENLKLFRWYNEINPWKGSILKKGDLGFGIETALIELGVSTIPADWTHHTLRHSNIKSVEILKGQQEAPGNSKSSFLEKMQASIHKSDPNKVYQVAGEQFRVYSISLKHPESIR